MTFKWHLFLQVIAAGIGSAIYETGYVPENWVQVVMLVQGGLQAALGVSAHGYHPKGYKLPKE